MKTLLLAGALLVPVHQSADQEAPEPPPSRLVGEHSSPIVALAASPDGSVLITAAREEVHAWDSKKDELRWKVSVPPLPIVALEVGEDLVVFHQGFAAVQFLELEDGTSRPGLGGTTAMEKSRCLAVDPKDRWVWIGTDRGVLTRVVPGSVNSWSNRGMDNSGVTCLAMDAKGNTLAVGGEDATVRFVGAKSANRDEKKLLEGHGGAVSAIAMDPKGSLIVSGSRAGDLRVWKYASGKQLHLLAESGPAIRRLAVDPKGKVVACGDAQGAIRIWDLKKGELLARLPAPEGAGAVNGLAFLGKGKTLASSWGGTQVTLWDLSDL